MATHFMMRDSPPLAFIAVLLRFSKLFQMTVPALLLMYLPHARQKPRALLLKPPVCLHTEFDMLADYYMIE